MINYHCYEPNKYEIQSKIRGDYFDDKEFVINLPDYALAVGHSNSLNHLIQYSCFEFIGVNNDGTISAKSDVIGLRITTACIIAFRPATEIEKRTYLHLLRCKCGLANLGDRPLNNGAKIGLGHLFGII